MKIAIMQPYLFPYLGYFQLIQSVDLFVIYDDVNYIKQGWINRNKILINEHEHLFTFPIKNQSSFRLINQHFVLNNDQNLLKSLKQAYSKAPYFKDIYPLLTDILTFENKNLSLFVGNSIIEISKYLNQNKHFIYSSSITKNNNLKGQDKVIEICKCLNASTYINSIGGIELYDSATFKRNRINLFFLKPNLPTYTQFKNSFVSGLSIIDMLMFVNLSKFTEYLTNFELITNE